MSGTPTQKELVYKRIRRAIISGELTPGEIMSEAAIATRFEAGKTPTREALLLLTHDQLLESLPRVGYMVTRPTMQDILETFHLRMILEVEAIGLAVERMTPEAIIELQKNIQREEMISSLPTDEQKEQAAALNCEFHLTITRLSGNSRLTHLVQNLIEDMERMLVADPYLVDPGQHQKILSALIEGEKSLAQDTMRQHIEETRRRILDRY
jgi:DNA-binding GntR family transcriptional regulator